MPLASSSQQSTTTPEQTCANALLLRNYDGANRVTIEVTISDEGHPVHETTVTLDPLTIDSVDLPIAPGDYQLRVATTDSDDAATCTLGDSPTALAFVEAGNGIVSVVGEAY